MLLDIFSSLDFQYSKMLSFSSFVWFMGFMWLVVIFFSFFFLTNISFLMSVFFSSLLYGSLESPKKYSFLFVSQLILSFSFLILLVNFWSLTPYIYGLTTNLVFGFSFAISFWLCLNLSNLTKNFNSYLSHFVSQGSPTPLGFVLTYMDFVSSVVRPFTLSLRLVIKVSMGHVIFSLLGLVGSNLILGKIFFSFLILFVLMFFYFMEIFVSIIQSLVFGLLNVNYLGEHT